MARKSDITVRSFVLCPEGPRPLESLTPEERSSWMQRMSDRLSESMSDYFRQHKDEYEILKKKYGWEGEA